MKNAIGVFDSGLGGLTAVKEIMEIMPNEDIVYFGDTGRVPYGSRSNETIIKYVKQDVNFLTNFDIKLIIMACGTASSVALKTIKGEYSIPIIGVVEPTVQKAVEVTKNKKIGILGTQSTIKSGSYKKLIKELDEEIEVSEVACPMFVPLVENGYLDSEATYIIAREYLNSLKENDVDTIILGCTHYPLLSSVISDIMGEKVRLINPGVETGYYAKELLENLKALNTKELQGEISYYVSDDVDQFSKIGSLFLNKQIDKEVTKIDIDKY